MNCCTLPCGVELDPLPARAAHVRLLMHMRSFSHLHLYRLLPCAACVLLPAVVCAVLRVPGWDRTRPALLLAVALALHSARHEATVSRIFPPAIRSSGAVDVQAISARAVVYMAFGTSLSSPIRLSRSCFLRRNNAEPNLSLSCTS